ncbi:MAG TPA: hypothetical protein VKY85_15735 [Candidatus Angelobacter sp.]|nr:hypothetical protein [Candidatus Angelobacter sp.]
MSNNNNARVLNRMGARELTQEEMAIAISGGDVHTRFTSFMTQPLSNPDVQTDQ